MRRKHQPTRSCVACRQARPKRELIRIVRSPEGNISVDESGKAKGRGAYLCAVRACWQRAVKHRILNYALKTELESDSYEQLREYTKRFES